MDSLDQQTDRRKFLRHLGIGVATGLGVVAFPAIARAGQGHVGGGIRPQSVNCCPDLSGRCGAPCSGSQKKFFCNCHDTGGTDYCTGCQANNGCYQGPC
jgi:hypothetical protein